MRIQAERSPRDGGIKWPAGTRYVMGSKKSKLPSGVSYVFRLNVSPHTKLLRTLAKGEAQNGGMRDESEARFQSITKELARWVKPKGVNDVLCG